MQLQLSKILVSLIQVQLWSFSEITWHKFSGGYKILDAVCHGEALQFDVPDGGARSKSARVALHRYMMGINGTHIACYTTKDGGDEQAEAEGTKRKILSDEEIDAGFDLIREDGIRKTTVFLFLFGV